MKAFFCRCWRGEARLWQAFWIAMVLGHILMSSILTILLIPLDNVLKARKINEHLYAAIIILAPLLTSLPQLLFASVSVWRCAPNSGIAVLKPLARIFAGFVLALVAATVCFLPYWGKAIYRDYKLEEQVKQQPRASPNSSR